MPIPNIKQPEVIQVDERIRLRKFYASFDFTFPWYQDDEVLFGISNNYEKYDMTRIEKMYRYLDEHGELYFIEVKENENYRPIGDVTFSREDLPIVIGEKKYRGMGIGRKVLHILIERAKELGYQTLNVEEIYNHNISSKKCFESLGFQPYQETEEGCKYQLKL